MGKPTLDYDALCIDTCVYEAHAFAFEKGMLKQLEQFASSPVSLVIPDVVHYELRKHLTDRIHDARTKVARAIRIASDELLVSEENLQTVQQLLLGGDDQNVGSRRLDEFCERTRAKILRSSNTAMGRLVQMYFSARPPFEASGKKKSEFPDGIALLTLEDWAADNGCKVLVVSTDSGWRDYCTHSNRLDLVSGLGDALAYFQSHNVAPALVDELRAQFVKGDPNGILDDIRDEIARVIELTPVQADASSSYDLTERYVEAAYLSHEFRGAPGGEPEINLIRVTSEGVVIQLRATAECEITAEYALSLSFRDEVPLGRRKVSTTAAFECDILLSLHGDFSRGLSGAEVGEVEVEGSFDPVDFGVIDPDPETDQWDREKYL